MKISALSMPYPVRLADLLDSLVGFPTGVRSPHRRVESFTQGETQSVGHRQSLAATPPMGGPFGIGRGHIGDFEFVAEQ